MATTHHGHYIPYSERTVHDDRAVRFAKPCGGINNCSDCKIESDEWQRDHLKERLEPGDMVTEDGTVISMAKYKQFTPEEDALEGSKARHPSSSKEIKHIYTSSDDGFVAAYQVLELLRHLTDHNGTFPGIFRAQVEAGELTAFINGDNRWVISGRFDNWGKSQRVVPSFETDWVVVAGNELFLFKDKYFHEHHQPIKATIGVPTNSVRSAMGFPPAEDVVNHPSHYTQGKIEVWDFILDQGLDYLSGNIVKYVCRAGKKDPDKHVQDLEKAKAYLERLIRHTKEQIDG